MSNLLYHAVKEGKECNSDIRKQVCSVGHKLFNHVEISAQEAVYFIVQMPLKQSSIDVIFINTFQSQERVMMLKSSSIIESLPDDSTDVHAKLIVDRSTDRPTSLQDVSLAVFVSQYKIVYSHKNNGG